MFRTPKKGHTGSQSPDMSESVTSPTKENHSTANLPETPTNVTLVLPESAPENPPKIKTKAAPAQKTAAPHKEKTQPVQESSVAVRRASFELSRSPPPKPKYGSRSAEAKACLIRAKTLLGESRNLKADIKLGVSQAIERLYRLVLESSGSKEQSVSSLPSASAASAEDLAKEVIAEIRNQTELVAAARRDVSAVKEQIDKLNENGITYAAMALAPKTSTYADAAGAGVLKRNPAQTALHSVIVSSKNEEETGEDILKRIRETVNAKDGWVKVERVRKVKDRRVIVGCASEEERRKVKERLGKASDTLNVEDIANKNPLVMLKDVLSYNTDQEVLGALEHQNKALFEGLGEERKEVEICFRKKTRNPHASRIQLQISVG